MPGAASRRSHGVYYTPPEVARWIVARALEANEAKDQQSATVLDPACGDGVFLREALRRNWSGGDVSRLEPVELYGVDTDRAAVLAARQHLAAESGDPSGWARRIRWADALVSRRLEGRRAPPLRWQSAFPEVFRRGGFDVVVGNPPYVNIRRLATCGDALRSYYRQEYECAYRGFDLYTLFLERAFTLLRPGGVCGMIVPNKLGSLDYALPCRRLLLEHTSLLHIADLAAVRVFREASVYPYVVLWRKQPAAVNHHITISRPTTLRDLDDGNQPPVEQSRLCPKQGFRLHGELQAEARVRTERLGDRCRLSSGTTGFAAQATAAELLDGAPPAQPAFPFIVSGNIDRYCIRRGNVRFMKRRFADPYLPGGSSCLSQQKRQLYAAPKIVISGLSRRLEAAWDPGGLALGVQVFAAWEMQDDPLFLLGVLNSKLMSYLFHVRFQAKRLGSGYLAVNAGQLAELPICCASAADRNRLSLLVQERLQPAADATVLDERIDHLVYTLYHLSPRDVAEVERSFP